jgi:hypothetical protein
MLHNFCEIWYGVYKITQPAWEGQDLEKENALIQL